MFWGVFTLWGNRIFIRLLSEPPLKVEPVELDLEYPPIGGFICRNKVAVVHKTYINH